MGRQGTTSPAKASTSRRRLLGGIAAGLATLAAGCLGGSSRGVSDVIVENDLIANATVSVLVRYRDDGEVAVDRSLQVGAGEDRVVHNEVVRGTDCDVEVDVEGGPTASHRWDDVSGPLRITVGNEIAFEEG